MDDSLKSKITNKERLELYVDSLNEAEDGDNFFKVVETNIRPPTKIILNDQQVGMVNGIEEYLTINGPKRPFYMVQGVGGSGKTTTIKEAIKDVAPNKVIVAAPSHFAKNVIADSLGFGYTVTTIASLLGFVISYDEDGNEVLKSRGDLKQPKIAYYPIVIIDEVSMVTDETAEHILSLQSVMNFKLILLGDYAQLPPVGQNTDCIFFDSIATNLTISMRFKGPIGDISNALRGEIDKIKEGLVPSINIVNHVTERISNINEEGTGYIFLSSKRLLLKTALKRFKMHRGANYVRIIAFRNRVVLDLNTYIRKGLFGDSPKQFEIGEIVINKKGFSADRKQIINNGEVLVVTKATAAVGPYGIPVVELEFEGKNYDVPIISVAKEGLEMYDTMIKRITKVARQDKSYWQSVRSFEGSFAHFNYSYACTTHNAQGSSINYVFVIEDDILSVKPTIVKEKLQSLYVAFSRASFRLYVYNKAFKVDNTALIPEHLKIDCDE